MLRQVARTVGLRRAHVAAARLRVERSALATAPRRTAAATGRVLCYHSVGTPQWGVNDVSAERFGEQIEHALALGHRFVPAATIAAGRGSAGDLAVTFDDGLLSVAEAAAPILAAYGIPWTLFVVTGWAEGRHQFGDGVVMGWRDVERLAAQGVEIGSHSVSHPDFGSLTPAAAERELTESRHMIEMRTGITPGAFAIPFGQSGNWPAEAQTAATAAGYEHVYAQSVRKRPQGTVARTFITQFDNRRLFHAALAGAFDSWEEWF